MTRAQIISILPQITHFFISCNQITGFRDGITGNLRCNAATFGPLYFSSTSNDRKKIGWVKLLKNNKDFIFKNNNNKQPFFTPNMDKV
jgi:hypothetical protein